MDVVGSASAFDDRGTGAHFVILHRPRYTSSPVFETRNFGGTPHFFTSPPLPFTTAPWTFEGLSTNPGPRGSAWARYGNTNYWYVPDERFESVATAAFHIMAITADRRGHGHGHGHGHDGDDGDDCDDCDDCDGAPVMVQSCPVK